MARLLADSLELQDLTAGYWFGIVVGGLDSIPSARGTDVLIPGRAGLVEQIRVASTLNVTLHGIVFGTSGTLGESYLSKMDALRAVFDPAGDTFTLTIHPDATGVGGKVGSGETATLNVRCLRFVGLPAAGDQIREFDIECESIDSPPEWVVGS